MAVPLKKITVDATVLGFIANIEYNLTYKNEEHNPIEAAFTFPLDEQSAIYKFEAEVEGRLIVGECQGKEQVTHYSLQWRIQNSSDWERQSQRRDDYYLANFPPKLPENKRKMDPPPLLIHHWSWLIHVTHMITSKHSFFNCLFIFGDMLCGESVTC